MMMMQDLKKEQTRLLSECDDILHKVRTEKRDLTETESATVATNVEKARSYTERIEDIARKNTIHNMTTNGMILPGGANGIGSGETWKDARGKTVPVLTKGESYSSVAGAPPPTFGFGDYIKSLVIPNANPEMQAALSEAGGIASGQVTVPTFLMPQLIDLMRSKTVCVQAGALTVPLETEFTDIARISADPVPAWRNESAAVAVAAPTFERVRFTPQSLAVVVQASFELLEDSVNLNQAISQAFAGAFAVELDRVALLGTGTPPQPHGIAGTTNVGNVSMGTNGAALTNYDPIVNAIQALLTANAAMPTAAVMAPRTLTKAALLKDTLGQPMRRPDLIANLPFLPTTSVPITQIQGTSSVASEIIVGDFTQLMIGIRTTLRIQILKELYLPSSGQIGFLADLRADIQLRHPQSFCEVVGVL
jgi:HK97 family phage major capsid protein